MTDKSDVRFGKHDDDVANANIDDETQSQKVEQSKEQRKSIIKDGKRLGGDKLNVIISTDRQTGINDEEEQQFTKNVAKVSSIRATNQEKPVSSISATNQEKPVSFISTTNQEKPSTVNFDTVTRSVTANVDEKSVVDVVEGKTPKTNVGEGQSIIQVEEKQTLVSDKKEEQIKARESKEYKKTGDVETPTGKFGGMSVVTNEFPEPKEQRKSIIKDGKRLGGDKLNVIISTNRQTGINDEEEQQFTKNVAKVSSIRATNQEKPVSSISATNQEKPVSFISATNQEKPSTVNVDTVTRSVTANVDEKSVVYVVEGKTSKTNVGEGQSIVQVEEKQTLVSDKKEEQIKARESKEYKKTGDVETPTGKSGGMSVVTNEFPELHGTAQWEALMRKFSQAHKETCKTVPTELQTTPRSKKTFPTGSTYAGSWNELGMSGHGTYEFPHQGVIYEGEFDDGMFHGEGELRYACGAILKGKWKKGKIIEKQLLFADGLEYEELDWNYLRCPDRRFTLEYDEGLEPAGRTYKTADQPSPLIPPGCYDVGDGFYRPDNKTVYKYNDPTAIIRSPELREQEWILRNCRTSPEYHIGPCPFLYETWTEPTLEAEVPPPAAARTKTFPGEEPAGDPFPASSQRGSKVHKVKAYDSRRGLTSATDFYKPEGSPSTIRNTSTSSATFRRSRIRSGNKESSTSDFKQIKGIQKNSTLITSKNAPPSVSVTEYAAPVSRMDHYPSTCGLVPPKSVMNW